MIHAPRLSSLVLAATLALVVATLAYAAANTAVAAEGWGPSQGTTLPDGLTASTPDGRTVALGELSATGNGLVVAFVRSADWCPFCKRQLIELSQRHADFAERGLTLVSISYDSPGVLKAFTQEFNIAFPLLSDPDSAVIDAFGIRNKSHKKGTSGYGIPHPGIMFFDTSGTLRASFAEKSYKDRPRIDDVLAVIDANL
ncbi:MAG: peroxiredoxin family protein [Pseudomonadota bacterium]